MAVAEFIPSSSLTKTTSLYPSQFLHVSTHKPRLSLTPLRRSKICCSVISKYVHFSSPLTTCVKIMKPFLTPLFYCSSAPVPVAKEPTKKTECFGVFCLTYDLKAVSYLLLSSKIRNNEVQVTQWQSHNFYEGGSIVKSQMVRKQ